MRTIVVLLLALLLVACAGNPTPTPITNTGCPDGCLAWTAECLIKGNINMEGEKIYHVPGAEYYEETSINTDFGERWFCTEEEARSNGWRKSKK